MFFFFFSFFLPCEKQTPKQTVTYLSCADRILNTIQQRCSDASEGTMTHVTTSLASRPPFSVTRLLTHDSTIRDANKRIHPSTP